MFYALGSFPDNISDSPSDSDSGLGETSDPLQDNYNYDNNGDLVNSLSERSAFYENLEFLDSQSQETERAPVSGTRRESLVTSEKSVDELILRVKARLDSLFTEKADVEAKMLNNDVISEDLASQLSMVAGDRLGQKFNTHVRAMDSVTYLRIGNMRFAEE